MNKEKFYEYAKLRWTNKVTRKSYEGLAKRIELFWDGSNLTQETFNRFQHSIARNDSYRNPLYFSFMRNYTQCYEEDLLAQGIHIKIVKPTSRKLQKSQKYKFIPVEDINRLLKGMKHMQLKVMIRLLFETGLRREELLNVKGEDIDFTERSIKGLGKGNKEFVVKFSTVSQEWLTHWWGHCPNTEYPFLFYKKGNPIEARNQGHAFWYFLNKESKKLGMVVTPHMLRHSLAHHLRSKLNFDLMEIKEALRHTSVASTQIYAPATREEVDERMEKEFFPKKPEETK
jgi:integrase